MELDADGGKCIVYIRHPETCNLPLELELKDGPLTSGTRFQVKASQMDSKSNVASNISSMFPLQYSQKSPSESTRLAGENTGLALCSLLRSTCGLFAPLCVAALSLMRII